MPKSTDMTKEQTFFKQSSVKIAGPIIRCIAYYQHFIEENLLKEQQKLKEKEQNTYAKLHEVLVVHRGLCDLICNYIMINDLLGPSRAKEEIAQNIITTTQTQEEALELLKNRQYPNGSYVEEKSKDGITYRFHVFHE